MCELTERSHTAEPRHDERECCDENIPEALERSHTPLAPQPPQLHVEERRQDEGGERARAGAHQVDKRAKVHRAAHLHTCANKGRHGL
mgnify:CR=1 FL=1